MCVGDYENGNEDVPGTHYKLVVGRKRGESAHLQKNHTARILTPKDSVSFILEILTNRIHHMNLRSLRVSVLFVKKWSKMKPVDDYRTYT